MTFLASKFVPLACQPLQSPIMGWQGCQVRSQKCVDEARNIKSITTASYVLEKVPWPVWMANTGDIDLLFGPFCLWTSV